MNSCAPPRRIGIAWLIPHLLVECRNPPCGYCYCWTSRCVRQDLTKPFYLPTGEAISYVAARRPVSGVPR